MTKQVRDWQEDKNELDLFMDGWFPGGASNTRDAVLAFFYFAKEALPYYHQQYAAEKKRADAWERSYYALQANMPNMSRCMRMITHSLKPQNPGKRNFGKKWNG